MCTYYLCATVCALCNDAQLNAAVECEHNDERLLNVLLHSTSLQLQHLQNDNVCVYVFVFIYFIHFIAVANNYC
jgi:hypothetical protein